jgi:cytosine/adenosine deaminase-related metal-dependent hydrolase
MADVHIVDGKIVAIRPGGARPADADLIDCAGRLVSPSFVEGHIHLDKTLLGLPLIPHRPGATVAARIANEKTLRRGLDLSVEHRGGRLIEQVAAFGTGALRSHVDIDTDLGLSGLDAVLGLKARYRDLVDIQIVAFPQSGILRDPGTAERLDAALGAGADLVGGLDPAGIDGDVEGHLDIVFGLAERHGVGIDIHLHDPGPLGAFELRTIAERTMAAGLQGRVAVSHAYALGDIDDAEFGRTAEALARAGVAIMTNAPGTGPMPPVLRLEAAGVTVFAGSDNIRDAWWPYGDGDMLDRAMMIGYRQGFYTDEDLAHAFAMATMLPARVLNLPDYGLREGAAADLVVLGSASVPEAVLDRPRARTMIKRGRVVVRDGKLLDRRAGP